MDKQYINQLLDIGFNIMPINNDKTPKQNWKTFQDTKIKSLDEFKVISEYYALICGFNDVEVIDIDLKILPELPARKAFFDELLELCNNHINDFNLRFCIKQTINGGYHIIYRADNIEGNLKLAKLDGYKEAIIETRGLGGYVCMYDNVINFNYDKIQKIQNEERDLLINICRTFNQTHEQPIEIDYKTEKKFNNTTPWADFNNKTNILDVVGKDFKIVRDTPDKIIIRRHGAKSPHSGYIFKKTGIMYLFSTGTQYEAQKAITPFMAYAINEHNADFSKAASVLYSQGYGDRQKPENKTIKHISIKEIKYNVTDFPLDIFPKDIVTYLTECKRTLNNSIDYMGCALLWVFSLVVGNAFNLKVKTGWHEIATLWISLVGAAGVGKSPSIKSIVFPIRKLDGEEKRRYRKKLEEYNAYLALDKKEQKNVPTVSKPIRKQFIVDDVTIEALIELHDQNPHGVAVLKDELAGWFKDMNKYKEGSDKEQWLSSWSGDGISVDRITRQSNYIARPIMPVLGGIQPLILSQFFTDENKDSGFLDRMLYTAPDILVEKYNVNQMDDGLLRYYNDWILYLFAECRNITCYDDNGDISPLECVFSKEAELEWIRIFNELTDKQNSDDTPEYLKPMLAKLKSYCCRFALLLNIIHKMNDNLDNDSLLIISKDAVLRAEKLVYYFMTMNEKMINVNKDNAENKQIIRDTKSVDITEKVKAIIESKGERLNKTSLAKELGISRRNLYYIIDNLTKKCN